MAKIGRLFFQRKPPTLHEWLKNHKNLFFNKWLDQIGTIRDSKNHNTLIWCLNEHRKGICVINSKYSPPATAQNLNVTLGGMRWELFTFFSSLALRCRSLAEH